MAMLAAFAPMIAGMAGASATTTAAISAATGLLGAVASASAMKASAKAEKQQLDYAAGQSEAAGQHEAELRRRKAAITISRGLAVTAASGGSTSGIEGVLAGIAGEGERSAQGALYESTEQAKGQRYKGDVGVASAKAKANATILGGIANAGMSLARFAPGPAPVTAGYENTYTSDGPLVGSRYDKQIWD